MLGGDIGKIRACVYIYIYMYKAGNVEHEYVYMAARTCTTQSDASDCRSERSFYVKVRRGERRERERETRPGGSRARSVRWRVQNCNRLRLEILGIVCRLQIYPDFTRETVTLRVVVGRSNSRAINLVMVARAPFLYSDLVFSFPLAHTRVRVCWFFFSNVL